MAEQQDIGGEMVSIALAKGQMERVEAYVRRGRRLTDLSRESLLQRFVKSFRLWSENFEDADLRTQNDDIEAELAIRRIDPPYIMVEAELKKLSIAALKLADEPGAKERIGKTVFDDFNESKGRTH